MIKKTLKYFIFVLVLTISCSTTKYISTIESCVYDAKTNQTTYSVIPFGSTNLPGKWNKTTFNKISYQQMFKNIDSISSAVSINQASNYPIYKAKMTSNQIVKELYEWDAKYWTEQIGANTSILKQDTINHFIIWQISADHKFKVDNYYLFGCENGIIFTVFINTEKWDPTQKITFLETVYKNKKLGTCCN